MPEDASRIHEVLDRYRAAVHAKDVDAFVALYDDAVQVFDLWGAWSHDGIAAWREMATAWFGSLGSEGVVVKFDDVRVIEAGPLATVHATVTYRAVSAEGLTLRAMNSRLSCVLAERAGIWKIVHEHTSVPLDPETTKGQLQRSAR